MSGILFVLWPQFEWRDFWGVTMQLTRELDDVNRTFDLNSTRFFLMWLSFPEILEASTVFE